MTRSFGYTRVSTRRQADDGVSLLEQPESILRYAAAKGLPVPLVFVDPAVQGNTPFADREGGAAIVAAARPGDHVIVTTIDRGFRNLADFLNWFDAWNQSGIHLHMVDFAGASIDHSTPLGQFVVKMFALIAEWEKKQIGARCSAAAGFLKAQGLYHNGMVPLGFKPKKNPKGAGYYAVPDPEVRRIMGQVLDWHLAGKTHWAIWQHCRAVKMPLPKGSGRRPKEWSANYVLRLCHVEAKLREAEQRGETA